ncbi:DUF177 domain-containing protein [Stackebrandtia albiflava]
MQKTPPPLDPKAPLVADARTMSRAPGTTKEWSADVPLTENLGLDMIAIPAGEVLSLRLRLTSVSEGILVTGTVSAPVRGECGRCLTAIEDTLEVDVTELYAFEGSTTAETTDEDEVMRLRDDLIDLEPLVRDALVFAMPNTPLCRPDCPGLCPDCGTPWDELPDDHGHEIVDPRWAQLKKLL